MINQTDTKEEQSKVREVSSEIESMFSTLADKSNDGTAIYQDGLIKFVNTKLLEITGYSHNELIDKSFIELLVPPAYKELVTNMYKRRLAGEDVPRHYQVGLQTKDGKDIPVEVNISPIEYEGKPAFIAIIRDITERKQAEKNLIKQEKILRRIAENFPNSFVSIIEKDLTIGFSAGQEFEKQNLNPKDYFGLPIEDIFVDQTEIVKQHYLETFEGKETSFELYFNNQYQLYRTVPLIDEQDDIQRILVVAENITERKLAEAALQESLSRSTALFEHAAIPIWEEDLSEVKKYLDQLREGGVTDFKQYFQNRLEEIKYISSLVHVRDVNKKSLELYNVNSKEELNKFLPDWFFEDSLKVFRDEIVALAGGAKEYKCEIPVHTPSWEIQYLYASLSVLPDHEEAWDRVFVSFIDLTERRKEQQMLQEKEQRFHSVFNQQFQFMAILSPEGRVLEINDLPVQQNGITREDYVGKFFWKTPGWKYNPEWQEKIKFQVFQATTEEDPVLTEDMFQNSDGAIRYADTAYSVIRNENNEVRFILVQANDITERKVAQESLSASEERYRRVIEDQSEFIVRWLPNGIRTFVNNSYCRYFGLKREEAIGKSFFSLISEEDRKAVLQRISELSPQKPVSAAEHQVIRPDGTKGWNLWTDRAFFDEEGIVIEYQSVGRDITERKKAEEELIIKEEAIESSINAIGITDLDGKVIYVNNACVDLWGYQNKNEIINKYLSEFWQGEGLIRTIKELKEKGFSSGEDTAKRKDGSVFNVQYLTNIIKDSAGNHKHIFGSFVDITKRKQAEEQLHQSEAHFRSLLENAQGFVLYRNYIDIEHKYGGQVQLVSPSIKDIMGLDDPNDFSTWFKDIHLEDLERVMSAQKSSVENKQIFDQVMRIFHPKKKQWRWIHAVSYPTFSALENRMYFNGIMIDITGRKQAEESLQRYQNDLKSLTSVITLVEERERRRIAENLHDHLTQSLAMAKIKLAGIQSEELSSEDVENLNSAREFLNNAIQNSRKITSELSPPILYELGLSEAVIWLLNQVEDIYKIKTTMKSSSENFYLEDDLRILLFRSINELINNSIKHSDCDLISVNIDKNEKDLKIEVRDDGKGFNVPQVINKPIKEGGFGLFSIKERLEYSKGSLWIDSSPGEGTRVLLSIPIN